MERVVEKLIQRRREVEIEKIIVVSGVVVGVMHDRSGHLPHHHHRLLKERKTVTAMIVKVVVVVVALLVVAVGVDPCTAGAVSSHLHPHSHSDTVTRAVKVVVISSRSMSLYRRSGRTF